MAERGKVLAVENETRSAVSRVTRDNRRLTYRLQVLQQPIRARACGSGAKSSADRRPVDPPPIVELKIFEGESNNEDDITFNMNANYFLFAMLEPARPIAQGRVPEDKNKACVLTGSPVSGMVYLDRPSAAGYFIFPDLSVRHEGKYRLSFSLYEELKNPNDFDKDDNTAMTMNNGAAHVTHRLEVKSEPFVVFSAKKFPGLTESTTLSRLVAEQGCRVRIRRDVRMRKRDSKPGKDWDDYEDDTAAARARMSATPDNAQFTPAGFVSAIPRPRSSSNTSHHSTVASGTRRLSTHDATPQYHPPPSQQYSGPSRAPSHGAFPPPPPSPFGPGPTQQYNQQPAYVPHHTAMQPPPLYPQAQTPSQSHPQQHQHYPSSTVTPDVVTPTASYYNNYPSSIDHSQPQSQPHFDMQPSQPRLSTEYTSQAPPEASHGSAVQYTPSPANVPNASQPSHDTQGYHIPPAPQYQQAPAHQNYGGGRQHQHPVQEVSARTAPQPHRPMGSFDNQLPPLQISEPSYRMPEAISPATPSQTVGQYCPPAEPTHKRSFHQVFDGRHLSHPLRDGARPSLAPAVEATNPLSVSDFLADEPDFSAMRYRRADGSSIVRALPPHN